MKLGDITILSSISPVQIKEKPSDKTIEMVAKLLANQEIQLISKKLREIYKQDVKGIDIKKMVGMDLRGDDVISNLLDTVLLAFPEQLVGEYGMHPDLMLNLTLLLYFNAFIDLEDIKINVDHPIEFLENKDEISSKFWKYPYEVCALMIPYNASRAEIKRFIDEHGEEIDEKIANNLLNRSVLSRPHKQAIRASEIVHKRDSEEKGFGKIATEMSDKYPDIPMLAEEANIRKIYYRHKKYWKLIKKSDIK